MEPGLGERAQTILSRDPRRDPGVHADEREEADDQDRRPGPSRDCGRAAQRRRQREDEDRADEGDEAEPREARIRRAGGVTVGAVLGCQSEIRLPSISLLGLVDGDRLWKGRLTRSG
jgi:hypothetical protein